MILKLRMPTHTDTCGWRIIDKISKVTYEWVDKTEELRKRVEKACFMWINTYPIDADPNSPKAVRRRIAEVHIAFEIGDRYETFYTDDMVYIMNDNGKTCDTINI